MIEGGLKVPALLKYLPRLAHRHFAYVGSVYGSGAWAAAVACAQLGYKCSLFIARSDDRPPWLSRLDSSSSTNFQWCAPLPVSMLHQTIRETYPDLYHLPLGFDTVEFIADMATVLRESIPDSPPEIWVPALSGVVARSACLAFPQSAIKVVSAVKHHGPIGHATFYTAPEKYHRAALIPPPYPSCPFSDAKVWQFAIKSAIPGAYILNVSL